MPSEAPSVSFSLFRTDNQYVRKAETKRHRDIATIQTWGPVGIFTIVIKKKRHYKNWTFLLIPQPILFFLKKRVKSIEFRAKINDNSDAIENGNMGKGAKDAGPLFYFF